MLARKIALGFPSVDTKIWLLDFEFRRRYNIESGSMPLSNEGEAMVAELGEI